MYKVLLWLPWLSLCSTNTKQEHSDICNTQRLSVPLLVWWVYDSVGAVLLSDGAHGVQELLQCY